MKRLSPLLARITGAILMLLGGSLVAMYIVEAVIKRHGEPDQSLVFWYAPFLLFGFIIFRAGIKVFRWSHRK